MGIFGKYRVVLGRYGVSNIVALMVLMAMHEFGLSYQRAIKEVAAFYRDAPERKHSNLCYWLLFAGIEEQPSVWFAKMVKEVEKYEEEQEYEDGIYADEGS